MIQVLDEFLENPDAVRASALRSGFGTWRPNKGDIGADSYGGVNFVGDHGTPLRALARVAGPIIPTTVFFRVTNPGMEHALIHSDREYGESTAILYLSQENPEPSGTAFYRHRETGMTEMPGLADLMARPEGFFTKIRQQMLDASDADWEMYRFVEARYNRCLVFSGPLIHCRIPKTGFGSSAEDSRMVWVCHFDSP